jgi:broad specificity phosphatase PhoE
MSTHRNLVLVRHSAPEIAEEIPPREWQLSDDGRLRCEALADEIEPYRPTVIATSTEFKARETALLVADILGLPILEVEGLHEHERADSSFHPRKEDFRREVEAFFSHRERMVFGAETAIRAYARVARAIDRLLVEIPAGNVVAVSHGRVIALFAGVRAGVDSLQLWKRLHLPSLVVLSVPGFQLERVVEEVT